MNTHTIKKTEGDALLNGKPLAPGVERLIKQGEKHYWIRKYRKGYELRETSWVLDENGRAVLRSNTGNLLAWQTRH